VNVEFGVAETANDFFLESLDTSHLGRYFAKGTNPPAVLSAMSPPTLGARGAGCHLRIH
jgi:hypothetical protein